jgi:hypothetical protein
MTELMIQCLRGLRGLPAQLAFAIIAVLVSPLARAQDIDDTTPCAASVAAMDSGKAERIRPFLIYIIDTMETMDGNHIRRGEPGIMGHMSDDDRRYMAAGASVNCRNYPKMTVYNSVEFVYRSFRDLGTAFGTAK